MMNLLLYTLILLTTITLIFLENHNMDLQFLMFSLKFKTDLFNKMMIMTVIVITLTVIEWSNFYLNKETKFILMKINTMLFSLSMIIFIASNNSMSCMMGWDGLGITSFLLIIYYNNWEVKFNGTFVLLTNKLGDCFLLFSITSLLFLGDMQHSIMICHLSVIIMLLTNCTKSSHLPFTEWLPLSMAAPTTISALVHSSTLVCGGIILQWKSLMMEFHYTSFLLNTLTTIYAGIMSLNEKDYKKLIAFSTMSQMSFMSVLISLNLEMILLCHMVSHAFFKSSMFMQIGNNIHANLSNQNITIASRMLMHNKNNTTGLMMNTLSLSGLTFTSGFLSKDILLEKIMSSQSPLYFTLGLTSALLLTIIYATVIFKTSFMNFPAPMKIKTFSTQASFSWTLLTILGVLSGMSLASNMFLFQNSTSCKLCIFIMIMLTFWAGMMMKLLMSLKHSSNYNIQLMMNSSLKYMLKSKMKTFDTTLDVSFKKNFLMLNMGKTTLFMKIMSLSSSVWTLIILSLTLFMLI